MSEIHFDQTARLATMARQIADFFRAYPHDKAVAAVADHINQFWTPRMREKLLARAPDSRADDDPLIAAALARIRPGKSKAD
jgi:formate dehydrogenase subunit delta